jgi:uncharacterized protein
VKTGALALSILLAAPGCSAKAGDSAQPDMPAITVANLPPRPTGPVLDQADIIPILEEEALDLRLRTLNERTGDTLVVVSVRSLAGQPIERYATALFNTWSIGNARTDRGLLVLVAPTERKVRIEVGCGFESTVTDEIAAAIISRDMLPLYRDGDLSAGTLAGVNALLEKISLPRPANDPGPHTETCKAQAREAA